MQAEIHLITENLKNLEQTRNYFLNLEKDLKIINEAIRSRFENESKKLQNEFKLSTDKL